MGCVAAGQVPEGGWLVRLLGCEFAASSIGSSLGLVLGLRVERTGATGIDNRIGLTVLSGAIGLLILLVSHSFVG